MKLQALAFISMLLSASAFGATPAIGVATAVGAYSVNSLPVSGSTNLTDGTVLQTTGSPSDIRLENGVSVRLATRSEGTIYSDHAELGQGAMRVGNFSGFSVNARDLQIQGDSPASEAVIRLTKKTVEVASIGGDVRVMDSGLLTRVAAGTKMSFDQTGATPNQNAQAAQPAKSGAAPAPRGPSDSKTFLWVIGICAAARLGDWLNRLGTGQEPVLKRMRIGLFIGGLVVCLQMVAQDTGWRYRKDDPVTKKHIAQIDAASFQQIRDGHAKLLHDMSAWLYRANGNYRQINSKRAVVDGREHGTLSYGAGLKQVVRLGAQAH